MTIETDVSVADAEAMVAKGGRILEHKRVDGAHLCMVEMPDKPAAAAEGAEEPKRRGRPPKSAAKG